MKMGSIFPARCSDQPGCVVVPVEPTEAMLRAVSVDLGCGEVMLLRHATEWRRIYAAMLAAAPREAAPVHRIVEIATDPDPQPCRTDGCPLPFGHDYDCAVWRDEETALHWIDRYASGIDDEPEMDRILECVAVTVKS